MKIKFLLVFFASTISYAQIALNDMKTILKMDYDSFETFTMNKGFSFFKIDNENDCESVVYTKGVGEKTKYITLYKKYFDFNRRAVTYRTNSHEEYLLIKQQLKQQGLSLYETFQDEAQGVLFKSYRDKKYELTLGTGKNELNSVSYEISLQLIN
jgi:hypothetical protein